MLTWQDHADWCLVHEQFCVVNRPRSHLNEVAGFSDECLVIANAGNCCQGWSAEGKRARGSHSSQHALATWVCQRKALAASGEEDMFFQECTPLFDSQSCLAEPLEETHKIIETCVGPSLLGWPTSRDRRLCAGLSLRSLVWVGPEDPDELTRQFEQLFARCCILNGSVFFQEDKQATQDWCLAKLKQRQFFGPPPSGHRLWRKILPPGQFQRLEAYQARMASGAALDGTYICDLDHWPDSPGPTAGPFFPVLLRHGTIVDLNNMRVAMGKDRFLSLGFHMTTDVSPRFFWPIAPYVLTLPDRHIHSLSGNCQSLPAIMAWQLYVFANTVRREVPHVGRPIRLIGAGDEDAAGPAGIAPAE